MSFGLSLATSTKEEYFKLIDDYKEHVSYIYYSPCDPKFFARHIGGKKPDLEKLEKEELEVLHYARANGIKLELAFNTKKVSKETLVEKMEYEKNRFDPDAIVTVSAYVDDARNIFGEDKEYIVSYNEGIFSFEQAAKIKPKFDSIVVGNRWLRDVNYMSKLKEIGYTVRLMLNNGCSNNCTYCFSDNPCEDVFLFNVSKFTIDTVYAINTILPFEVHEYLDGLECVDMYKISNRPNPAYIVDLILYSYINNINFYDDSNKHLDFLAGMSQLAFYKKFIKFIEMDKVFEIKKKEYENRGMKKIEHNDK